MVDTVMNNSPTPPRVVALVVAPAKQSGKSLVASLLAAALETDWIASSDVVTERLEARLGLAPGTVKEARHANPETFRDDLVAEGNRMTAAGEAPGVLCVRRGYGVIDGIRRESELAAARAQCETLGRIPVVICVTRRSAVGSDNTEAAAMLEAADYTIANDGSIEDLAAAVAYVAEEMRGMESKALSA